VKKKWEPNEGGEIVFKKSVLYTLVAVLIVAAMLLSACGPTPTPAPQATEVPAAKLSVGVVLPTKNEPRWIQDETRFNDAFKAAGYDVQILFSDGDSAKEKANVEALVAQGVQVIVICPHDATAAAAAAAGARAAGVKVISYDRLIRETEAVDYYVTFDSISVGEAQGQYLVDKASGTGNPLYLYAGAATDNNAFLFFEGAWNVLQPKIADGTFVIKNSSEAVALQGKATLTRDEMGKIIGQVTTEWLFDVAKKLAEAHLTAASAADKGDVFILAPNDGTARAIADVFAADTDVTSYVVTGQDAEIPCGSADQERAALDPGRDAVQGRVRRSRVRRPDPVQRWGFGQGKGQRGALITQGVQVIIICPHDATAAAAAAAGARDAGVKVISYDRLIRETEAVDYYVTFDSISVGEAQAQYLVDKASGTGNPLYLYAGAATDNNAFLFFEGAWNVLQPKIADGTF
jgi:putative multiple sugar transport system substrate-binding protein